VTSSVKKSIQILWEKNKWPRNGIKKGNLKGATVADLVGAIENLPNG
jgi:hypothetical protein